MPTAFRDDFNDGIRDNTNWTYESAGGRGGPGSLGHTVEEHFGYLDFRMDVTDDGGAARLHLPTGYTSGTLDLTAMFHAEAHSSYYGTYFYYGGFQLIFHSDETTTVLSFNMYQADYEHVYSPRITAYVIDSNGTWSSSGFVEANVLSSSMMDRWLDMSVGFDVATGQIWADLEGDGIVDMSMVVDMPSDSVFDEMYFGSFGWWQGHFMRIDDIAVTGESRPPLYRPTDIDLEYMAKQTAYDRGFGDLPPGYIEDHSLVISEGLGFVAVALISATGEPVLAIRGTASALDLVADVDPLGVGYSQARAAWPEVRAWLQEHPGAHITGHSLGGAQAQLIASWATSEGLRIGNVATFNSPGIDSDVASLFVSSLALGVEHHIAMGDIVSMVGETFLTGHVTYYDFQTIDVSSFAQYVSHFGPLSHAVNAHVGHWAHSEMMQLRDASGALIYDQYDESVNYRIASGDLDTATLSSPTFSHLTAGNEFDIEYFTFLYTLSALRLPNISVALETREGAEGLRTAGGLAVLAAANAAQIAYSVAETIAAATVAVASWSLEAQRAVMTFGYEIYEGLASFNAAAWQAARTWTVEIITDLGTMTTQALRNLAEVGIEGLELLRDMGNAFQSISVNLYERITDTLDAADFANRTPEALILSANGSTVAASSPSVLIAGNQATTLQSTARGSLFIAGAGIDTISMTTGNNSIFGTAQTLNNDRISSFGVSDVLTLLRSTAQSLSPLLTVLQNSMQQSGSGTTQLVIDFDQDGITDTTINLEGIYNPDLFSLSVESGNVVITYDTPTFTGDNGSNSLIGTIRQDLLLGNEGDDTLDAGSGDDTLQGGSGDDSLVAGFGDDILDGGEGADRLYGEEGSDSLTGGAEADLLDGGVGNDTLDGGHGNDRLDGGDGEDWLRGDEGADTLVGGFGDDFLFGGAAGSTTDLRDVIYGGDGNDSIDGGHGNDDLNGGEGNDTMLGGFGSDTVIGNAGNDLLVGGAGSDLMFGGPGNDTLNGGFGFDRINGGTGADSFFHLGVRDHASDWIQDYNAADGDVLTVGITGATRDQFQVNFANTVGAGVAGVQEAFIIYRPTGQILWALVDGGDDASINIQIGGQVFDLLA